MASAAPEPDGQAAPAALSRYWQSWGIADAKGDHDGGGASGTQPCESFDLAGDDGGDGDLENVFACDWTAASAAPEPDGQEAPDDVGGSAAPAVKRARRGPRLGLPGGRRDSDAGGGQDLTATEYASSRTSAIS